MMDELPADVADRRYERWVMRTAELVCGEYPDDREEAERMLLVRMQDGFVGSVPPIIDFLGEAESTLEEVATTSPTTEMTTWRPHAHSSSPYTRRRVAMSGR